MEENKTIIAPLEFKEFENPVNSVASVFDGQWKTVAYNPDI